MPRRKTPLLEARLTTLVSEAPSFSFSFSCGPRFGLSRLPPTARASKDRIYDSLQLHRVKTNRMFPTHNLTSVFGPESSRDQLQSGRRRLGPHPPPTLFQHPNLSRPRLTPQHPQSGVPIRVFPPSQNSAAPSALARALPLEFALANPVGIEVQPRHLCQSSPQPPERPPPPASGLYETWLFD